MITYKNIIGKIILVGITYYSHDEQLIERKQFYGEIISADRKKGITFLKQDGETYTLPPDLRNIKAAPKGEYKLHSTGEVVVNPDLLSTWNLYAPE